MFTLHKSHAVSAARLGSLLTSHGTISTPAFMPIATKGAVRTLPMADLVDLQLQLDPESAPIVLSNTYHLFLRPGLEVLAAIGGARTLMNWPGVMLTDSGGYQVFSLAQLRSIDDDGVTFNSHIDGAALRFTPEVSMQAQSVIGSSIWCPGHPASLEQIQLSVERTTTWARRCKDWQTDWRAQSTTHQSLLFGIVQGGTDVALRKRSATELQAIGFDGYAIGGLAVGEPPEIMLETVAQTAPLLPVHQVRYLMGVGTPDQILAAVRLGVDLFDCVIPTRNARHGTVFIKRPGAEQLVADDLSAVYYEKLHLTTAVLATDLSPIEPGCGCPTCSAGVSRALIRHLFSVQEPLAMTYATTHNVWFYMNLMHQIRQAIRNSV